MANLVRRGCALLSIAALLSVTGPAWADDSTTTTGIAAGLGLTAASGKTTFGAGAGAIEAALLGSDAMLMAGAAIRQLAKQALKNANLKDDGKGGKTETGTRNLLILTKDDTIDFSMALWIVKRMEDLMGKADRLAAQRPLLCSKPTIVAEKIDQTVKKRDLVDGSKEPTTTATSKTKFGFARSDIVAALATEVSVGGIELTSQDRTLIDAILMGGSSNASWYPLPSVSTAQSTDASKPIDPAMVAASADNKQFRVLSELPAVDPRNNTVFVKLAGLQAWTDTNRHCDSDEFKAMIDTIDKFVASVTTTEKGVPAVVTAAQLASYDFANLPLLLRVSIDNLGGTSVTRSNIWFTLGLAGAGVVSSGLKVSFRIDDPKKTDPDVRASKDPTLGPNLMTGQIRCITKPISYRDVRHMLVTVGSDPANFTARQQKNFVTCGYRLS